MLSRKKVIVILFCCLMLLSSVACKKTDESLTETTPDGQPKIKDTFVAGVVSNPSYFDPQMATDIASVLANRLFYDNLIKYDLETKEFVPGLAETWEQISDTEYVFNLREGVKFHNGNDFTADDVIYTFTRGKEKQATKSRLLNVDRAEKIDNYTVKIILSNPDPVFINTLTNYVMMIIPDGCEDEIAQDPIGTGPYKFVENLTDSHVKGERNEEYWAGARPSKYIVLRIYPEPAARLMALEAGDTHFTYNPLPSDIETIESNPDLKLIRYSSAAVEFIGFNVTEPPFDDIHARRAVAYAVNREGLIEGAYEGLHNIVDSPIPPVSFGYNDNLPPVEYNLEKAKEELALSKYPDGFEFNVYTTKSRATPGQLMQYDLSQAGITMNLEFVTAVMDHARGGYKGALWSSSQNVSLDGGDLVNLFMTRGSNNVSYYSNPQLDRILQASSVEIDVEKRRGLLQEAQAIIREDMPRFPLWNQTFMCAINKDVKGLVIGATTDYDFSTCYVEMP